MADCREQVYSDDFFDFIVSYEETSGQTIAEACIQRIDEGYDIYYYPRERLPPLSVGGYSYSEIPKCYGLLDRTALEVSGILKMQNQPVLALKGNGVLIGFIDTGIDYTNPAFRYSDGSSRIVRIWDQTIQDGTPPAGILYGAEYTKEQINAALFSEDPYDIVPSRDTNGHGTFLAGVACASESENGDFIGAAPQSEIIMIKLKEAKQYLRDFFFVKDGVPAYQENDIMMAVSYLNSVANILNRPLVICMALGNSAGSHASEGFLPSYLNYMCGRRKRVVVVAAGNEANARHHFQGRIIGEMEHEDAEITVEQNTKGFFVELWASAPELYAVAVISPSGEQIPRISVRRGASEQFNFIFEGTTITVDYRIDMKETSSQLIFFRFIRPTPGLWTIRIFPQLTVTGNYQLWLPLKEMTDGNNFFLRSNPEITLTSPSAARQVITVGGYQASNTSIYADSGRGYTTTGEIKPDFVAPAVDVYGPGLRNNFITFTGTSAAAAITAGACAQIMQWAIVDQNNTIMSHTSIKNMLIRGTAKPENRTYPNREWGYGTLDVYGAFQNLRL